MQADRPRTLLLHLFSRALQAVRGADAVKRRLLSGGERFDHVVAIGKAAGAMLQGALAAHPDGPRAALIITKEGHTPPALIRHPRFACLESAHPYPDARSLAAGEALLTFLAAAPGDARFLFLISGGASALAERLPDGVSLEAWQRANQWLLGSGLPIGAVNRVRRGLSCIKGGGLIPHLRGRPALALLISDVPGDEPAVIGSGPLVPQREEPLPPELPPWLSALLVPRPDDDGPGPLTIVELVATNADARAAAVTAARDRGIAVTDHGEALNRDLWALEADLGPRIGPLPPGLHLWGGEPTVRLPAEPGRGGRAQALALALARRIAGRDDLFILCAGTDGSDGPTDAAGALVDGGTVARGAAEGLSAEHSLAAADAGRFLEASGDLVDTGPTGTNVMDLLMVLKLEPCASGPAGADPRVR